MVRRVKIYYYFIKYSDFIYESRMIQRDSYQINRPIDHRLMDLMVPSVYTVIFTVTNLKSLQTLKFCLCYTTLGEMGRWGGGEERKRLLTKTKLALLPNVGRRLILHSSSRKMSKVLGGSRVGGQQMSCSAFQKHMFQSGVRNMLPP